MKTYTLTWHRNRNYGAFLQAFALQKILGQDNQILDYAHGYKYKVGRVRKIPLLWKIIGLYRHIKTREIPLKEIEMLNLSKYFSSVEQLLDAKLQADCFIVGSDQVWSRIKGPDKIYFLDFVRNTKKISYAASRGLNWSKEDELQAIVWLKEFSAVSVREQSFADYLNELGIKAISVCDPTILHKADFYRKEFDLKKSSTDYIFIYRLRENMPIFVNYKIITVDLQKKNILVSVRDWLSLIDKAEFVLTDSFHCVVFCLLFHKSFVIFRNSRDMKGMNMNERFTTILGKTNLEYRLLEGTETEEQILEIVKRPIDWERVDVILEKWRNYSIKWLEEALVGKQ